MLYRSSQKMSELSVIKEGVEEILREIDVEGVEEILREIDVSLDNESISPKFLENYVKLFQKEYGEYKKVFGEKEKKGFLLGFLAGCKLGSATALHEFRKK